MEPVSAQQVLDEMSRDRVQKELIDLAVKVEALIDAQKKRLAIVDHQMSWYGDDRPLMPTIYQIEMWRLGIVIQKLRNISTVISEVVEETSQSDYRHLLAEVTYLKDDTFHCFGFNPGALPRDARQHLHAAARHLRVELSSN